MEVLSQNFWHSIALPNIVYIYNMSVFPLASELHERAPSHCSLLWYEKGIVYQQIIQNIGVETLNSTTLQSFVHVSTQVIELHKHECPILMYGPKLFFVVFQKKRCLHKCYYAYFLRVTELYHPTKFHVLVYFG